MITFITIVLLSAPVTAARQPEACLTRPAGEMRNAITARDALRWARAEAGTTDADAALTRMLSRGSISAEGRADSWMLELVSLAGKRLHVVMFSGGTMSCSRHAFDGPIMATPISADANLIVDVPRLIQIARDASTPQPDPKLKASVSLQQNAGDDAPRWSISFVDDRGYPKGQVTIDAMTGAVVNKTP